MAVFHPRLGAEVFQIDPQRCGRHGAHECRRRVAGKSFNHNVRRGCGHVLVTPMPDLYRRVPLPRRIGQNGRNQCVAARQVVDPQPDVR